MTVCRILNRWVQDGNSERHAGSQRPLITSSREDRHVTRMALMSRAASSRALSQELGFCLHHQDGRIRVGQHYVERTVASCIRHSLADQSPGVMVWSAIRYTSRSPIVCIDDTVNYTRYISGVLRFEALPFIRTLTKPAFQ
ncbi:uncharacterized protein TNCV_3756021 [Trichonephila clavipes]|nr:uncharacterized protein TNCV_3756021 [Trichonephila clavipes]